MISGPYHHLPPAAQSLAHRELVSTFVRCSICAESHLHLIIQFSKKLTDVFQVWKAIYGKFFLSLALFTAKYPGVILK